MEQVMRTAAKALLIIGLGGIAFLVFIGTQPVGSNPKGQLAGGLAVFFIGLCVGRITR